MYAICDGIDGHLVGIDSRPQELPHITRDRSMQFAHTIVLSRQPQREYSHTISRPVAVILACHLHKLVAVEPQLSPVGTKIPVNQIVDESIITCRYGRVRRKKRVCGNHLARLVETQARSNQFPATLQVKKSSVPFINMPCGR